MEFLKEFRKQKMFSKFYMVNKFQTFRTLAVNSEYENIWDRLTRNQQAACCTRTAKLVFGNACVNAPVMLSHIGNL